MSNSGLVDYTKISPNSSSRTAKISKITLHHMAGNLSVEACGKVFETTERQASSNYGVGTDGRIGLYVEESCRAWTSSNRDNDNVAVTIEVANDGGSPDWHVSDKALESTIALCVDICQRNGIAKLNFTGDTSGNLTMHKWFANTQCPGKYLESKFPYIADEVNKRLGVTEESTATEEKPVGNPNVQNVKAKDFVNMTPEQVIDYVGSLFTADQKKTGVLASVSLAQFCLESGYGKADMPQECNNCFSMKTNLSGNNWAGSVWGGKVYNHSTGDYRSYNSIAESIEDHSAYLIAAMNGDKLRYEGLKNNTDHAECARILKAGGYATDPLYVEKLIDLNERWNLSRFNADTQVPCEPQEKKEVPYTFAVKNNDTYIYSGAGYGTNKKFRCPVGTYTIVCETVVYGTAWGCLKSGIGWIPVSKSTNSQEEWEPAVGDVVAFTGHTHFTSANASYTMGHTCHPGKARITSVYPNGLHPYHVVYVKGGGSTVYGWVDANTIEKA